MVPESSMSGAAGAAAGRVGPAGGALPGPRTASSPGHSPGMMPRHHASGSPSIAVCPVPARPWAQAAGSTAAEPKSPPRP